jgi:hypothetical protein
MVNVPEAIKGDPHPRTGSLCNIRANRQQQAFDVQPVQVRPGWSLKNCFQSPSLFVIHKLIVSYIDTIRQEPACSFWFSRRKDGDLAQGPGIPRFVGDQEG